MVSLVEWFNKEVLRWRTGSATAWSLILTVPFSLVFLAAVTFSPFDPYSSLYLCLLRLQTRSFWQIQTILWCCVLLKAAINSFFYRVHCEVARSRLMSLWLCIRPHKLLLMTGHMAASVTATVCFMKLTGQHLGAFSLPCLGDREGHCLNERYLFIVVSGCFFACTRVASLMQPGYFHLIFPLVKQRQLFEVKTRLGQMITASCHHCLTYVKYHCLLYYLLLGGCLKSFIAYNLLLSVDSELTEIDTIRGVMDISLIVHTWLIAVFVDVILALPHLLTTIYHTQPFSFPVETTFDDLKDKCLHHAISCDSQPLLQMLGCMEMCRVAKYSPSKRRQIFCLTTLGAQPINWLNLHNVCVVQLRRFIDSLNSYQGHGHATTTHTALTAADKTMTSSSSFQPHSQSAGLTHRPVSHTHDNGIRAMPAGTPLSPIVYQSPGYSVPTQQHAGHSLPAGTQPTYAAQRFRVPLISLLTARLGNKVGQMSCVRYFTDVTTEALSRQLFVDSDKLIYIVDGLSHLVSASYTEDSYGVVQSSLPGLLTVLLDTLETLERHLRLCPVTVRRPRVFTSHMTSAIRHRDILLRSTLKSAIKSAVYRIVVMFHEHLKGIELSTEHRRRLKLFEEYRE